jgi:anti-sigma B factor antagonist
MAFQAVPAEVNGWIEVSEQGAMLVLRIGGELDRATRDSIEPAVAAAIASAGTVVLDLAELTFCDSSGIAMFVRAHEDARARGTALATRNARPSVRRVFEITGIDAMIPAADWP